MDPLLLAELAIATTAAATGHMVATARTFAFANYLIYVLVFGLCAREPRQRDRQTALHAVNGVEMYIAIGIKRGWLISQVKPT